MWNTASNTESSGAVQAFPLNFLKSRSGRFRTDLNGGRESGSGVGKDGGCRGVGGGDIA